MQVITSRVDELLTTFPQLDQVVRGLTQARVPWVMGGSAALYAQGNPRLPGDIDIYVRDDCHDALDQLFGITSVHNQSATDRARISYPAPDKTISIHSQFWIRSKGQEHQSRLRGELASQDCYELVESGAGPLYILKAEDIIIIKAQLRRGHEHGRKKDLEDIRACLRVPSLDRDYLRARCHKEAVGPEVRQLLGV